MKAITLKREILKLEIWHGETESAIFLKDDQGILGRKYYTRRIHKYESKTDFDRLNTQLQTYGYSQGLLPEWERSTWAAVITLPLVESVTATTSTLAATTTPAAIVSTTA